MKIINLIKRLLAISFLYTLAWEGVIAQNYKPCDVEAEYCVESHNKYAIDSVRIKLSVQIPCNGKPIDYKIVFSEIQEVDFLSDYCKEKQNCKIEEVVTQLNKKKKCAILVEFSDGYFDFLSSLSGAPMYFHNTNLIKRYAIFHQDKRATFFIQEVYPRCYKQAFIYGEKFRLYILFLEQHKHKFKPINFMTEWMDLEELLTPTNYRWRLKKR